MVSATLFLALFAAQSGLIVLAPVLADLARDLDVSTAAAGQLRTVTGLAAAITALGMSRASRGLGLGAQLLTASALLAVGSLGSALAPSFGLLAVAQVPVGIAVGGLTTATTIAAAEWVRAEDRLRVLSWALMGQPASWLVGLPLVGFIGGENWRRAWLALPLFAALLAVAAAAHRMHEPPSPTPPVRLRAAVSRPEVATWLGAETLANTAWAGTIVYAGALLVEAHGAAPSRAGVALSIGAAGYVAGNRVARALALSPTAGNLAMLGALLAAAIAAFGTIRSSFATSVALFAAAGALAGARTLVSSARALSMGPELRAAVAAGRAASMQLGYFVGSSVGGLALLVGGYTALGGMLGALPLAGAVLLLAPGGVARAREPVAASPGACTG